MRRSVVLAAEHGDTALRALSSLLPELGADLGALAEERWRAAGMARAAELRAKREAMAREITLADEELAQLAANGFVFVGESAASPPSRGPPAPVPRGAGASGPRPPQPSPSPPPPAALAVTGRGWGRGRARGRGRGRGRGRWSTPGRGRGPPSVEDSSPERTSPTPPPVAGRKRKFDTVYWCGEPLRRAAIEDAVRCALATHRAAGTPFDWTELKSLLSPASRGFCTSGNVLAVAWKRWGHPDPCAAPAHLPDGYGPDLYGDEEDRARLEAMPETMREAELYERGEARRRSLEGAGGAAAAVEDAGAAPPAKVARRGEDTFRLGKHDISREALEAAVANASGEHGGPHLVWASLWKTLLPAGSAKPGNTKQIRRVWQRWHPEEESEGEEEPVKGAERVDEAREFRIGLVNVGAAALNAAVAAATQTSNGRRTCDWAAAAAAAAPGSGMLADAAAQLAKEAWEEINQQMGAPTP